MPSFKNKVALVTGGGRGIGKAIAERYGARGASVVVNYSSSADAARETVNVIQGSGGAAIAVQADVSKVADIERLFQTTLERFGHLDIAVVNAGLEMSGQPVLDFTEEDYDRLFNINTKGAFFTMQKAAKYVADNGRILFIGSSTTAFPMPGHGLYGGSKMAPRFLVEVLAKEIGHRGVTVNSDEPDRHRRRHGQRSGVSRQRSRQLRERPAPSPQWWRSRLSTSTLHSGIFSSPCDSRVSQDSAEAASSQASRP